MVLVGKWRSTSATSSKISPLQCKDSSVNKLPVWVLLVGRALHLTLGCYISLWHFSYQKVLKRRCMGEIWFEAD